MRMYDPKPHKPPDNDLLRAAGTLAQYARYTNREGSTLQAETELALYVQRSLLTLAGADAELFTLDVDQILRDRTYHPTVALTVLDQIEDDEEVAAVLGSYIIRRFNMDVDLTANIETETDADADATPERRDPVPETDRCASRGREYFAEGDWYTEKASSPPPDPDDWMGPEAVESDTDPDPDPDPESPMERANTGRIAWSDPPQLPLWGEYEADDKAAEKNRTNIWRARRDPTINTGHLIW